MNNKNPLKYLVFISIAAVLAYLMSDVNRLPVEKLGISAGVGYDIDSKSSDNYIYSIPVSMYVVTENKQDSMVFIGKGVNIAETRQDRQLKFDRRFLLGFEKVYLISEDYAKEGISNILDLLFNNQTVNDSGLVCVYKGKTEDILEKKLEGYPSSADFIEGLIRASNSYNFFSKNYKLLDLYARVDSEGRCAVLPYIEMVNNKIQITGLAVFKKDKMAFKLNMENTRLLNILKENKTQGIISIQDGPKDYASFYLKSKRKVKCYKEEDKYKFVIDIELKGDMITNELADYNGKVNKPKPEKSLEEIVSKDMEKKLNGFIEIMKNEYKIDCLDLGRVAAAKYGREDNRKWDNIVCNSEIKVNVKMNMEKTGRGDY